MPRTYTETYDDGYIVHNAVKLLPEESDPIYIKLVQLSQSRGIKVYLVDKIVKSIKGLCITINGKTSISLDSNLKGDKRCF